MCIRDSYTPIPIKQGLRIDTNTNLRSDLYGDGRSQNVLSFSAGPILTLGRLERDAFDYTEISVTGGASLQKGESPFNFDRNVDLSTISIGWKQQLFGPLFLSGGVGLNIDKDSEYYGNTIGSYAELTWQRRSYGFAVYYSPYERIGGIRLKLNDFNYKGTGLPFVPYTPTDFTKKRQGLY